MRKLPFRAGNEISQMFNDGFIMIYRTENGAIAGYKAREVIIAESGVKLPFEEQRVGLNRYYLGKEAGIEIEKVYRVPRVASVQLSPQEVVVDGGVQYRIEQIQSVEGIHPPCYELSLSRIEVVLDVT